MGVVTAMTIIGIGCGGGGADVSAPLNKAEFVKQANDICGKVKKETDKAVAAWKKDHQGVDPEDLLDGLLRHVAAPAIEGEAIELETLQPPVKDETRVARMLQRLSKAGEVLAEKGFKGLSASRFSEFQREASSYDLDCDELIYQ